MHLFAEIAIVSFLLVILGIVVRHKLLYHFQTIDPGKMYRCGILSPLALRWICRKYRIKTILVIVSNKELSQGDWFVKESAYCLQNKIHLIHIPLFPDNPPTDEQIHQFLRISMDPQHQPILIHCNAGVIRTNMMVAIYLKSRFQHTGEELLEQLPFFGHDLKKRPAVRDFILRFQPKFRVPSLLTPKHTDSRGKDFS